MRQQSKQTGIVIRRLPRIQNTTGKIVLIGDASGPKPNIKLISKTTHMESIFQQQSSNLPNDRCSSSSKKAGFHSHQIKSVSQNHSRAPSTEVKLQSRQNLQNGKQSNSSFNKSKSKCHNRQSSELTHLSLKNQNLEMISNTTKVTSKEHHGLNFFEKPKISGLALVKIMKKMMGTQEQENWNQYWKKVEKKISSIEQKQSHMEPDESTENLFTTEL